ncbi:receptor expression-enhancing protein 5 isoform X2 [Anabrus simplex]|uniref:receptor expression-enhancing protein 5 isoform X2 n=1 Tax=Anabrus simplex TaxID=316456 RepID=UPI0034DD8DA2
MGSRITGCKESLDKALHDDSHPWTFVFAWMEEKTGVKRLYIFLAAIVFTAIYMVFGYAAQLFCGVIGFVYPAYCSIKALESPGKDDDTKWLTYWVVFAAFSIVEYFSDFLLHWFPFYWLAKCLFHIWCFVPLESNGSMVIYHRIIRPKFLKHQEQVDNTLRDLAGSGIQPS